MITRTSVAYEFFQDASYDDVRKTLKRIAEFDFANPKSLDAHDTNLMLLMLEACKEHHSVWNSYFTDVQYLLMFPRRRSEVARAILAGGGDRESVLCVLNPGNQGGWKELAKKKFLAVNDRELPSLRSSARTSTRFRASKKQAPSTPVDRRFD